MEQLEIVKFTTQIRNNSVITLWGMNPHFMQQVTSHHYSEQTTDRKSWRAQGPDWVDGGPWVQLLASPLCRGSPGWMLTPEQQQHCRHQASAHRHLHMCSHPPV